MRFAVLLCSCVFFFRTTVFADDAPKALTGTWMNQTNSDGPTTWIFEQKGDTMKVAEMKGSEKVADFECNTMGRECQIQENGKKAKVTMYFNGPKLVELDTRGSDIVKRRFTVNGKGDTVELEVIPISPGGKPETLQLKRVEEAAQNR